MIFLLFVVLFLSIATYQEIWGSDRESVPFWMGLAIINIILAIKVVT